MASLLKLPPMDRKEKNLTCWNSRKYLGWSQQANSDLHLPHPQAETESEDDLGLQESRVTAQA